ncbi:MAG: 5-formyltetrahydrofolate cyclo-ligase [uncultured Rubrobacteraceae bacterium]|uniref:5-formyltetrahydrofolate cyclo-ligase n=1 Tax=uncultured Rubrobacteraceae bacterium TaxID=349277 RepID=A0A6J4RE65_9ACTN|nr:MAG: 5-formyltetrahydrofolate cyclo-ligase [uncultured Rubrobacteraceae bacterium]
MPPETKAALRRAVLLRRDALPEGERALLGGRIVRAVLDLPTYENAGVVLAYASFGTELQTDGFLRRVLADGKTLLLPRVDRGALGLYEVRDPAVDLEPGRWGIREPKPDRCSPVEPGSVEFALVPGVAFDRRGRRLGYGGGFYDRLLAGGLPEGTPLVSGAFGVQILAEVPTDPHDAPVDLVVTETNTYARDEG